MFSFLAFSCLVAVAVARPDVSLGYKYPAPGGSAGFSSFGSSGGGGAAFAPSFSSGSGHSGSFPGPSFSSGHQHSSFSAGPSFSSGSSFGGSGFGGSGAGFGGSGAGFGGSGGGYGGFGASSGSYDEAPIVTKHFYLHAAPEEQGEAVQKHFKIGRAQKHYRVVFIKAPADGANAAQLSAEYAPTEEKTVIYVLSKKADGLEVSDIATPAPTEPSKPEVYFIKYKTEQEAAHAQTQIQAQYDSLGGSSQVSDEGVSQVSSVVGALGGDSGSAHHHHHIGSGSGSVGGIGSLGSLGSSHGSQKTYLPPSK